MKQGKHNADMLLCIGIGANGSTESVGHPLNRGPTRSSVPHAIRVELPGPHANDEPIAITRHPPAQIPQRMPNCKRLNRNGCGVTLSLLIVIAFCSRPMQMRFESLSFPPFTTNSPCCAFRAYRRSCCRMTGNGSRQWHQISQLHWAMRLDKDNQQCDGTGQGQQANHDW